MKLKALIAVAALAFAGCATKLEPQRDEHHLVMKVVDDGSPYMKRLFDHVANDRQTTIRAEMERWHPEPGDPPHTDYFLSGPAPKAIERYVADAAAGDPTLRVPVDRELAFERFEGRWRTYLVFPRAEIDETGVARAKQSEDPSSHREIVLVDFTPAGAKQFAALTERIQGHKLATIVDGVVVSAPIVNGRIAGGRASISLEDPAQTAALVKALDAKH